MEVINITKEQRKKLCEELANIVFEFREDKSVKCICFTPYRDLGNRKEDIIGVTLVRAADKNDDFDKKVQVCNMSYQQDDAIQKFGLRIYVDTDDEKKYTIPDLKPSELKMENNVSNSVILFDETGEYTEIKDQTRKLVEDNGENIPEEYNHFKKLAEIVPPLEDALFAAMDIKRMERDTEAVKQFTKSKLFEQLKNM